MQIVIDIDEKSYKAIIEQVKFRDYPDMKTGVAIANGTPLPKGHGRLIDADKLKCIYPQDVAFHKVLQHSKTVIKADKENGANV